MDKISRRSFFKVAGAAAAATAVEARAANLLKTPDAAPAATGTGASSHAHGHSAATTYMFFNPDEAHFIEAACERLIPHDDNGPGALDAGVPSYIDKQLGGAWGAGERLYRSGPWKSGSPTQGYQLPFTPAELFRHALRGIQDDLRKRGNKPFAEWSAQDQDAYLKELEKGGADLDGVPSKVFFSSLLNMTIEGYFSDPVYGGNRDMVSWKMIGFPGAYANYYHLVDNHGMHFQREPISLSENNRGMIRIHPNIPARDTYQKLEGK